VEIRLADGTFRRHEAATGKPFEARQGGGWGLRGRNYVNSSAGGKAHARFVGGACGLARTILAGTLPGLGGEQLSKKETSVAQTNSPAAARRALFGGSVRPVLGTIACCPACPMAQGRLAPLLLQRVLGCGGHDSLPYDWQVKPGNAGLFAHGRTGQTA
jgi:hypothetical protein